MTAQLLFPFYSQYGTLQSQHSDVGLLSLCMVCLIKCVQAELAAPLDDPAKAGPSRATMAEVLAAASDPKLQSAISSLFSEGLNTSINGCVMLEWAQLAGHAGIAAGTPAEDVIGSEQHAQRLLQAIVQASVLKPSVSEIEVCTTCTCVMKGFHVIYICLE